MSVAESNWNVEGKNCGFWVGQADACTQSIHVTTVIVAALATITVLGGVLLILAQQGYSLGGINSLSKLIQPSVVYATVAFGGVVLVFDIAFICTLVRAYKDQVYSKEELDAMKVLTNIQEVVTLNLAPMHYTLYISPEVKGDKIDESHPGVYAVMALDKDSNRSITAFKTEQALLQHLLRLESSGYQEISEEIWKQRVIFTLEEVKHLLDHARIQYRCELLAKAVPNGYFTCEPIYLTIGGRVSQGMLFAGKSEGKMEYFITRHNENPKEIGAKHFSKLVNLLVVEEAVEVARLMHAHKHLDRGSHVQYEHSFMRKRCDATASDAPNYTDENTALYIITYRLLGVDSHTEFFLTEEERIDRLKELKFMK